MIYHIGKQENDGLYLGYPADGIAKGCDLFVYPPSFQRINTRAGFGEKVIQYYIPVPWVICLADIISSNVYGNCTHVRAVCFAKANPLNRGLVYRAFLPDTWWDTSVVTALCACRGKGEKSDKLIDKAALTYSIIWETVFTCWGDIQYLKHPVVNKLRLKDSKYLQVNAKELNKFFTSWESMNHNQLNKLNWGKSQTLNAVIKHLRVTKNITEIDMGEGQEIAKITGRKGSRSLRASRA